MSEVREDKKIFDLNELLAMQETEEPIPVDALKVRGFYRVAIEDPETEEIVGDSGWKANQITNEGFRNFLVRLLGALAGSSQVNYVALGTGGAPLAADTALSGEVQVRTAVTAATSSDSKGLQFTATFSSAGSFVTTTMSISNIGLFYTNTGGTVFAGNTYASSTVATNQNVNITYVINFA